MKFRLASFAVVLLSLLSAAAFAQTEYDIPDGTSIDYIYYTSPYPYTNTFASDYPITVDGISYLVDVSIHFVPGNPAATSGSITFAHYTITGATTVTENLTAINYNPFSLKTATAKADFAGQFNGSLTFNIQQFIRNPCNRYCAYDALTTVNEMHSNFTLYASTAANSIYKCGSDKHDCLADGTGACPKALPNCKPSLPKPIASVIAPLSYRLECCYAGGGCQCGMAPNPYCSIGHYQCTPGAYRERDFLAKF